MIQSEISTIWRRSWWAQQRTLSSIFNGHSMSWLPSDADDHYFYRVSGEDWYCVEQTFALIKDNLLESLIDDSQYVRRFAELVGRSSRPPAPKNNISK